MLYKPGLSITSRNIAEKILEVFLHVLDALLLSIMAITVASYDHNLITQGAVYVPGEV